MGSDEGVFRRNFPMIRLAIIDGIRTPFSKAGTDLKSLPAQELGRIVVSELLERTGFDSHRISQVIFGCVAQPPEAANIARVIALMPDFQKKFPPTRFTVTVRAVLKRSPALTRKWSQGRGMRLWLAAPRACRISRSCFRRRRRTSSRRSCGRSLP